MVSSSHLAIQNVVVVNQAAGGGENVIQVVRANNYSILTRVLFVIFCLTGQWTALLCVFPALIFSCIVSHYYNYICTVATCGYTVMYFVTFLHQHMQSPLSILSLD